MANFSEVKIKFETAMTEASTALKTFVFDDLSGINKDRSKEYPVLLWKVPQSQYADASLHNSIYDIDFFVFDLERQEPEEQRLLEEIWSECEEEGMNVIRKVFEDRPKYGPAENPPRVNITRGHNQHNAKVVGVRFQFKLKVYNGC